MKLAKSLGSAVLAVLPILMLAPGESRAFRLAVTRPGLIGVGVRADRSAVDARLFDAAGVELGRGAAIWRELEAGSYSLLVSLPGGVVGFLIFVNVFVFFLAFFLDFFEIAFIVIPLLGPAAERLGIDLIWFGVILGVNMQTSFMHPPFGFALFYLRSVAPREPYTDRVSGTRMAPVTTGQIYWGAVPFVVIQCIAVALVIAFPALVMHYKGTAPKVDPSKIEFEIPQPDMPPPLDLGESPKRQ